MPPLACEEGIAVDLHTHEAELRSLAAELLHRARRTVRGLDQARIVTYRVCVRPLPVDGQSIVGRLPGAGVDRDGLAGLVVVQDLVRAPGLGLERTGDWPEHRASVMKVAFIGLGVMVYPKAKGRLKQVRNFATWVTAEASAHEAGVQTMDNGAGI